MIIINSTLPTTNIKIAKSLPRLIQGYIYHHLPNCEHEGYKHKSGKIFKKMNFDFYLKNSSLRARFTSCEPKFEEMIATAVLKEGFNIGDIHLIDTNISIKPHRTENFKEQIRGCVVCATKSLLGENKVYLEPQDSRHLEIMKNNALERFETITGYEYEGEFDLVLKWQNLNKHFLFYYGNNNSPLKTWQAKWEISAKPELINLILETGVGSGCMSHGVGLLEIV